MFYLAPAIPDWEERVYVSRGLVSCAREPFSGGPFKPNSFVPRHSGEWFKLRDWHQEDLYLKVQPFSGIARDYPNWTVGWFRVNPFNSDSLPKNYSLYDIPLQLREELEILGVSSYGAIPKRGRILSNFPLGHTTSANPFSQPGGTQQVPMRVGIHRDQGPNDAPPSGRVMINMNANGVSRYFFFIPNSEKFLSHFWAGGAKESANPRQLEEQLRDIVVIRIELRTWEGWVAIPSFLHDGYTLSGSNTTLDIKLA